MFRVKERNLVCVEYTQKTNKAGVHGATSVNTVVKKLNGPNSAVR